MNEEYAAWPIRYILLLLLLLNYCYYIILINQESKYHKTLRITLKLINKKLQGSKWAPNTFTILKIAQTLGC